MLFKHARDNGVDAREQTRGERAEFDVDGVTAHVDAAGAKATLRVRYLSGKLTRGPAARLLRAVAGAVSGAQAARPATTGDIMRYPLTRGG